MALDYKQNITVLEVTVKGECLLLRQQKKKQVLFIQVLMQTKN